jgi:hypothetical protein
LVALPERPPIASRKKSTGAADEDVAGDGGRLRKADCGE